MDNAEKNFSPHGLQINKVPENMIDESVFPINFHDFKSFTNLRDVLHQEVKRKRIDYEEYIKKIDKIETGAHKMYIDFYAKSALRQIKPLCDIKPNYDCPLNIFSNFYKVPQMYRTKRKKHKRRHITENVDIASVGNETKSQDRKNGATNKILYLPHSVLEKLGLPIVSMDEIAEYEARFPITFATFKKLSRYEEFCEEMIKEIVDNDETVLQIFRNSEEWRDQILRGYYVVFYKNPTLRERYKLKLKACPQSVRSRFLSTVDSVFKSTTNNLKGAQIETKAPADVRDMIIQSVEVTGSEHITIKYHHKRKLEILPNQVIPGETHKSNVASTNQNHEHFLAKNSMLTAKAEVTARESDNVDAVNAFIKTSISGFPISGGGNITHERSHLPLDRELKLLSAENTIKTDQKKDKYKLINNMSLIMGDDIKENIQCETVVTSPIVIHDNCEAKSSNLTQEFMDSHILSPGKMMHQNMPTASTHRQTQLTTYKKELTAPMMLRETNTSIPYIIPGKITDVVRKHRRRNVVTYQVSQKRHKIRPLPIRVYPKATLMDNLVMIPDKVNQV